ncbi:polysaccharide deacetylase family protein [Paenibacillus aceris]|uniref:Polysaccharide deacetylase family sporulation protein PdaB n=1 Tax=Paenibacillus aceris TaxID=869555 RepID=A0ABS4I8K0_9BACL|nr:polysaccharide deacetylase family protein [Paenibacillus aceris]MBP1967270.1 polysaccharide deacetylase family sporulation protein PdaB [Paenibacillus aceris]NHW33560.1 polysaccharide deacetylase family protein [Paenibacillus aceris]
MNRSKYVLISFLLLTLTTACAANDKQANTSKVVPSPAVAGTTTPDLDVGHPPSTTLMNNNVKALYYAGPEQGKQVALTFDDGPDNHYTMQILDILKKNNVKATFFIVGENAKAHPEVVKRIVNEGHVIGNHSWDHSDFTKISNEEMNQEINTTQDELNSIVGFRPTLFRPPFGALSSSEIKTITSMGLSIVDWSVDTRDWAGTSTQQIMRNVKKELKPGGIILQHCAIGKKESLSNTVKALEQLIPLLKNEGYTFVTVPTLLSLPESQK